MSNKRKGETPKPLFGFWLLFLLIEVKIVPAQFLMFFSWSQFLVLMYLVTYLGRLCNGLTVLIIGKTEKKKPTMTGFSSR